jgi:hypothetical protein
VAPWALTQAANPRLKATTKARMHFISEFIPQAAI